jgi:predicted membrane-bound spermidine synthase
MTRIPAGLRLLFALFFLSGFCGLIYESIWSHYLKLFLGHAAYAQTVVLVVFIGGMAVGAWACGRFAPRIRNPLLAYAAAEFAIGLCALAFHRLFVWTTDWAYSVLLPATCSAEAWCLSSWILAAALILPQSILLGTTFPLMTSGILRALPQDPGRRIALLYFLNSFGAVFGVLASAFVLIPAVGLPGASTAAGLLNMLLALCVTLIARRPGISTAAPSPEHAGAHGRGVSPRLLLWVALLTGLTSFVYEIVWIRMLSLVLGSSTHAFELMLASFILGLALGGAWIRGRIDTLRDPRRFLAAVQILMGLLAIATIGLYNASFDAMAWMLATLSRTAQGYVLFNVGSSLVAMAIMIAPTFMAGMTLPLITFLLMRTSTGERSIGYVYAWNTLGSIAGVFFAVHVGLPQLGLKFSLASAAMIDVLLGIVLAWPAGAAGTAGTTRSWTAGTTRSWTAGTAVAMRWRAAAVASLAIALAATAALDIDPMRTASGVFRSATASLPASSTLLFHRDGKTATVDVVRHSAGHLYIQSNGKPDASYQPLAGGKPTPDEYTQFLVAGVALAHRPQAEEVAIIGFGSGLTTAAMLANPAVRHVDTIEIEPAMIEGAQQFRQANEAAFSDPRSRIVHEDAKSFFARSGRRYDVVISEPSNPWVSGVSSLFTQEFYARLRQSIKPEGILVQWIHGYEFSAPLLASILGAMGTEFRDYVAYRSGNDLIIIAMLGDRLGIPSDQVFRTPALSVLSERYAMRGPDDLDLRRVGGRATLERLLPIKAIPANSDYHPYVDSRAAEVRFLGTAVTLLLEIDRYPIPLIDLFERRRWVGQSSPSEPSRKSADTLSNSASARPAQGGMIDILAGSDATVSAEASGIRDGTIRTTYRLLLEECASAQTTAELWDEIVTLAIFVNTSSRPDRAQAFWLGAARSGCLARLPGRYRTWLSLFAAVGAQDPERMTRLGTEVLEGGALTQHQRAYVVLCALAGSLVRQDAASARRIVERWMPQLSAAQRNAPAFTALRALSGL